MADEWAEFNPTPAGKGDDPWAEFNPKSQSAPAEPATPLGQALKPLTSYPETYNQMRHESQDQMSRGLGQLGEDTGGDLLGSVGATAKGLGNLAAGAAGYVASPIAAGIRTVVGKPVEENTGIPKEYTEFATGLAIPGYGMSKIPGAAAKAERAAATYEKIADAAKQDYKAAHGLGVEIKPSFVHDSITDIKKGLLDEHFTADELSAPHTMSALSHNASKHAPVPADPMAALTGTKPAKLAAATIEDIDGLRQQLGAIKTSAKATRTDRAAASIAQSRLDELMSEVPKDAVLKGDAGELNRLMQSARGNHAAMRRMDVLAGREELADLNTGSAHAGGNEENATRQAYKALIRPNIRGEIPAKKMGFSPKEIAEIRKLANGDVSRDTLRAAGKLGPDAGLKAWVHAEAAIKSGGASLPFTGATYAAKKVGEKLTRKQVGKINDLVASRAPASVLRIAPPQSPVAPGWLPTLTASQPEQPPFRSGGAVKSQQKLLSYLARNKQSFQSGGAVQSNLDAAHSALDLTPQERALYERHLSNLTGPGGVDNPDGSRSTLYQLSFEHGGKTYNVPSVYDGKIVPPDDAINAAFAQGIDKFPSYPDRKTAEKRYEQMHQFMEGDTSAYFARRR